MNLPNCQNSLISVTFLGAAGHVISFFGGARAQCQLWHSCETGKDVVLQPPVEDIAFHSGAFDNTAFSTSLHPRRLR
jgi:hypothetical protein